MYLVALWYNRDKCPGHDPDLIQWDDGSPASIADYRQHLDDTSQLIWDDPRWLALRLYPDVSGTVSWDISKRRWKVEGRGIGYFWLDDLLKSCLDSEIYAELSLYPIVYRCLIVRS